MHDFSNLYNILLEASDAREKIDVIKDYLSDAAPADAAWAIYLLSGKRPRRVMSGKRLASIAMETTGTPLWLFEECYNAVGDMVETATLLLPEDTPASAVPLHVWMEDWLLAEMAEKERQQSIVEAWRELNTIQRYIFNKLLTGGFRSGITKRTLVRAIAEFSSVDTTLITHRLEGEWLPTPAFYEALIASEQVGEDVSRPYPFVEIQVIETRDVQDEFGDVTQWQVEWTWGGIRVQVVKREGQVFVWTHGEVLVTRQYPEILGLAATLPDSIVLEGDLLPWKDGQLMPLDNLQKRVNRKNVSKKLMAEVPLVFVACDVLEVNGEDVRHQPLAWRREQLIKLVQTADSNGFHLSETIEISHWDDVHAARITCRERLAEGLVIKHKASAYSSDHWWKWKAEPYKINGVLMSAQRGEGDQANLYREYTFGVWDDNSLVPIAKTDTGLSDSDIREIDRFVRQKTMERFGPVRTVAPALVFEIGFDGLRRSKRHKSGIAVESPRVTGWRLDLRPADADTLDTVRALLPDKHNQEIL
ncbi:MAG: ATP-dependent DNA ligase [Chloroflexi bacterium]|nr:ATP-dependent DNA ligase [Chloroflexota bacterium]